jgi:hypothetical protein
MDEEHLSQQQAEKNHQLKKIGVEQESNQKRQIIYKIYVC